MIARPAEEGDIAPITAIYAHHVLHGLGSFEETPPEEDEIAARIAAIVRLRLPYLVARDGAATLGFAYAAPFRPRASYRFTAEDSVFVAPSALRRGIGGVLLAATIKHCAALGLRQMMAVIGDSANQASIGLHRSLGFSVQGVCRSVGFKHGRWVDTVWMQRPLNAGDGRPPSEPGLKLGGA